MDCNLLNEFELNKKIYRLVSLDVSRLLHQLYLISKTKFTATSTFRVISNHKMITATKIQLEYR